MKQRENQQGFTLLEMVFSLAIMAVLATMVLLNFRNVERSRRVQLGADTTISAIRQLQSFAQSGKDIPGSNCTISSIPHKEAQIYYLTLATTGTTNTATISATDKCNTNFSLQTFKIPTKTTFTNIRIDNASDVTSLKLYALPPFAGLSWDNNNVKTIFTSIAVTVSTTDGAASRNVKIDGLSGKIE